MLLFRLLLPDFFFFFMPPAASTEDVRMTSPSKNSNTRLCWKRILVMNMVELGMTAKVESQKWCVGRRNDLLCRGVVN